MVSLISPFHRWLWCFRLGSATINVFLVTIYAHFRWNTLKSRTTIWWLHTFKRSRRRRAHVHSTFIFPHNQRSLMTIYLCMNAAFWTSSRVHLLNWCMCNNPRSLWLKSDEPPACAYTRYGFRMGRFVAQHHDRLSISFCFSSVVCPRLVVLNGEVRDSWSLSYDDDDDDDDGSHFLSVYMYFFRVIFPSCVYNYCINGRRPHGSFTAIGHCFCKFGSLTWTSSGGLLFDWFFSNRICPLAVIFKRKCRSSLKYSYIHIIHMLVYSFRSSMVKRSYR